MSGQEVFKKKGETEKWRLKLQIASIEACRDVVAAISLTGGSVKPGRAPAGAVERFISKTADKMKKG